MIKKPKRPRRMVHQFNMACDELFYARLDAITKRLNLNRSEVVRRAVLELDLKTNPRIED